MVPAWDEGPHFFSTPYTWAKWWFNKGTSPKSPKDSGLGIIRKFAQIYTENITWVFIGARIPFQRAPGLAHPKVVIPRFSSLFGEPQSSQGGNLGFPRVPHPETLGSTPGPEKEPYNVGGLCQNQLCSLKVREKLPKTWPKGINLHIMIYLEPT